jgi:hypothetical protein
VNPLLLDIVDYLQSIGLVTGDGEDAFRDYAPDKPDSLVCLYEYAGQGDTATDIEVLVNRSVQCVARDYDADTARSKAQALFAALRPASNTKAVDYVAGRFMQMHMRQTPFKIKQDPAGRFYYGFNMGITTTID